MKKIYLILAVAIFSISQIQAQTEKTVNKSFDVGNSGSLSIRNSFGDIDVESHDGDMIEVEITITVETKNNKDVQEYLEKIKIDVTESGNEVSLKTINNINGGNKVRKFSIDYDVQVPSGTDLKIRNTFGDLTIEDVDGHLDINVQHGDAFIGTSSYTGDRVNELNVQFGDLKVEQIHISEINVQHGDFLIGSSHGGDVDLMFGEGSIGLLSGKVNIDVGHSDMDIDDLGKDIESILTKLQFSDFRIGGVSDGDFKLELEGNFTDFDWEGTYQVQSRDKGMNSESFILFSDEPSDNSKLIRIRGSHSDVNIK